MDRSDESKSGHSSEATFKEGNPQVDNQGLVDVDQTPETPATPQPVLVVLHDEEEEHGSLDPRHSSPFVDNASQSNLFLGPPPAYAQTERDALQGSSEPLSPQTYGIDALFRNSSRSSGTHTPTREDSVLLDSRRSVSPQSYGMNSLFGFGSLTSPGIVFHTPEDGAAQGSPEPHSPMNYGIDTLFRNNSSRNSGTNTPTREDSVRHHPFVSPHSYDIGALFRSNSFRTGTNAQNMNDGVLPDSSEPNSPHTYGIDALFGNYSSTSSATPDRTRETPSPQPCGEGALYRNRSFRRPGRNIQNYENPTRQDSHDCKSPQASGVGPFERNKSFRRTGTHFPYPIISPRKNEVLDRNDGGEGNNTQGALATMGQKSSSVKIIGRDLVETSDRSAESKIGMGTPTDESRHEMTPAKMTKPGDTTETLDGLVKKFKSFNFSNLPMSVSTIAFVSGCVPVNQNPITEALSETYSRLVTTINGFITYLNESTLVLDLTSNSPTLLGSFRALATDLAIFRDLPEAAPMLSVLQEDYISSILDRIPELVEDLEGPVNLFQNYQDTVFEDGPEYLGIVMAAITDFLLELLPEFIKLAPFFRLP